MLPFASPLHFDDAVPFRFSFAHVLFQLKSPLAVSFSFLFADLLSLAFFALPFAISGLRALRLSLQRRPPALAFNGLLFVLNTCVRIALTLHFQVVLWFLMMMVTVIMMRMWMFVVFVITTVMVVVLRGWRRWRRAFRGIILRLRWNGRFDAQAGSVVASQNYS